VLTTERARNIGGPLHADTAVLAELRPDDGPPFQVCFASVDRLRDFIADMQPRAVTVECAPGEDAPNFFSLAVDWAQGMQSRLEAGSTVH
jgi:hypothetical protein